MVVSMMINAVSRHEVKDFDAWKRRFDANAETRREAGLVNATVHRDIANPSVVFVFFEWDSTENARAFLESLQLKAAMVDAGVVGVPQFNILRPVE